MVLIRLFFAVGLTKKQLGLFLLLSHLKTKDFIDDMELQLLNELIAVIIILNSVDHFRNL